MNTNMLVLGMDAETKTLCLPVVVISPSKVLGVVAEEVVSYDEDWHELGRYLHNIHFVTFNAVDLIGYPTLDPIAPYYTQYRNKMQQFADRK